MQPLKTISACSACLYSLDGYPSGRPLRAHFVFLLQSSISMKQPSGPSTKTPSLRGSQRVRAKEFPAKPPRPPQTKRRRRSFPAIAGALLRRSSRTHRTIEQRYTLQFHPLERASDWIFLGLQRSRSLRAFMTLLTLLNLERSVMDHLRDNDQHAAQREPPHEDMPDIAHPAVEGNFRHAQHRHYRQRVRQHQVNPTASKRTGVTPVLFLCKNRKVL